MRGKWILLCAQLALTACSSNDNAATGDGGGEAGVARNPDTTAVVAVDRFSDTAAHLFKRSANASFPAANAPIACDQGPFITHGFGPDGEKVAYYNFDIQPSTPAPIYVLFAPGATMPVAGQLNIVDVLPGDTGYNDFWLVTKVDVPASYVANTITSLAEIQAAGLTTTATNMIVNCPVVPDGSTANLRYTSEPTGLQRGWYRDQVVKYFSFDERALTTDSTGAVPVAQIFVTFNKNPDPNDPTSGPPSGFETEPGSLQTHNVPAVLPEDTGYSPLWAVTAYDNASFASVSNLATAKLAPVLVPNAGLVNCPIVSKSGGIDGGVSDAGPSEASAE